MFEIFANIFGFILNIINNIVKNYGLAIILFTILIKVLMLPISIKQQKTMKKNAKLQEKIKVLQFKYKNDQEKLSREMMNLYKEEKMSPFSGCLSAIIQLILLLSIFYMVRSPLTYMENISSDKIDTYVQQLKENGKSLNTGYKEMDVIREIDYLKEVFPEDQDLKNVNINMNFLGLDLSKVPQQSLTDWTVYIIPILYIISSFISIRLTNTMQGNMKKAEVIDVTENEEPKEKSEMDLAMEQSNKMMSWMMPIMSVSISLVAPLGLALYWLVNNILMI